MAEGAEDTIAGDAGADTVSAAAAEDTVSAAAAEDTVSGAAGDDSVAGDDGNTGSQNGAPESYEDFKLPDGTEIDSATMDAFKPLAKELNLTQDGAQKLVDMYVGLQKQQTEAFEKTVADWANAVKADKEIGGAAYDQSVAYAKKAVEKFGSPALQEALNFSGMGSHPEVIRMLSKIGAEISEDTGGLGGDKGTAPSAEKVAESMFGKSLAALKG